MVSILRDAGLSALVADGAMVETLADGFQFTEGPLWCADGSVLVQDIKAEVTYRLRPGHAAVVVRTETRAANGQTFTADGRIVFCEQNGRRVSRMNPDGSGVETVAETWSGQRLNSPNDVICRSDGLIYFTDPPYGVAPADRALHFQGVYALDLHAADLDRQQAHDHEEKQAWRDAIAAWERVKTSSAPRLLLDDFEKPNGLGFSPDERTLYVCDTARYHVRAFSVDPSGDLTPGSGRVFARLDPGEPGGPDGMKVDRDGRVYVAVALGVWVFEPSGKLLGILALPKRPANLAWCDPNASRLVITAVDSVYSVRMKVKGVMPPFTPKAGAGSP